jgi:hypothetical protein
MEPFEAAEYTDPVDLLRRFIPTPLRTRFRISDQRIAVETNDFALLPAFPLEPASDEYGQRHFAWKLVRDPDAPGMLEKPLFLRTGKLTIVAMGTACLLGLDHELRELLCFIGPGVDSLTFQEFLVPLFCRLTLEDLGNVCESASNGWGDGRADA